MIGYIAIAASLGLPLALGLFFRVSTSHLFFSIMSGELLARYLGHDVQVFIRQELGYPALAPYGEVTVLLAPVLITALIFRNSMNMAKTLWHAIPLALTGVVLAAFVLPILPEAIQADVRAHRVGNLLIDLDSVIVGIVVTIQLLAFWTLERGKVERRKKGKKD